MSDQFSIQSVRDAITTGENQHVLAVLPESHILLAALFALDSSERDTLYTGVYAALENEEDRWELLEAAVMYCVVNDGSTLWPIILPFVSDNLRYDLQHLLTRLPETDHLDYLRRTISSSRITRSPGL